MQDIEYFKELLIKNYGSCGHLAKLKFAKHMGCSLRTVYDWEKKGMVIKSIKTIDKLLELDPLCNYWLLLNEPKNTNDHEVIFLSDKSKKR